MFSLHISHRLGGHTILFGKLVVRICLDFNQYDIHGPDSGLHILMNFGLCKRRLQLNQGYVNNLVKLEALKAHVAVELCSCLTRKRDVHCKLLYNAEEQSPR